MTKTESTWFNLVQAAEHKCPEALEDEDRESQWGNKVEKNTFS